MLIGQRLGGKYEIQAEIGRGGMGIVYRGFDVMLQRPVAVKVLPREFTYDPQFVQRFRQEAVMAAGLHHPGIVTIHDVGEQEGLHYIVMQFLEGSTLDQWLVSHGPLPLAQTNHIVRQVAEALDYAHSRGIVHRDIKPSNIMVGPSGQATVMDFGLVRAGEGAGLTRTGTVVGTPEYMAPEQALGQPVDSRTDIYSLGVVIYKLLAGQVPFDRSTPMAIAYAHVHEPPPLLRHLRPDVPRPVEAVVLKALAKRPEDRYQRAGLLADHLAVAISGKMPTGLRVAPTPAPGAAAIIPPVPAESATPPSFRPVRKPATTSAAAAGLTGQRTPKASPATMPRATSMQRPMALWLAGLATVVLLVVIGVVLASRGGAGSSGDSGTAPPATAASSITLPGSPIAPAVTAQAGSAPAQQATTMEAGPASATPSLPPPTVTPSATRLTPTSTPTSTATATPLPTPSPTATASRTPAPTAARPQASVTPTRLPPTATPRPATATLAPPTDTPRPPPTDTPQPPPPTNTPVPEPTNTPAPEATNTPAP